MPLELAEVVAGFPVAASLAIVSGISALREGRRRASLNEAVHELRRPLQVLSLSLPADSVAPPSLESSLRLAAAAVDRLEREINGEMTMLALKSLPVRRVVEASVERWRSYAALADRPLTLDWKAGEPTLQGDEIEFERMLDNLISNAFEHGEGEVSLEVQEAGGLLRVTVRDSGTLISPLRRRNARWGWTGLGGRSRHGHGLRIVRRAATRQGGAFRLCGIPGGTEARLELPLDGGVR